MRKAKVRKCVFCSPFCTVKRLKDMKKIKTKKKLEKSMACIATQEGMQCSKCKRFACVTCLQKIITKIPKRNWDVWCKSVNHFVATKQVRPVPFIGHCCEHNIEKKTPLRDTSHQGPLSDGDLFLPEFQLLIKTSFSTVDIHALAPDRSTKLAGAWHCTIQMEDAIAFNQKGLHPKAFECSQMDVIKRLKISLPWTEGTLEYVSFLCRMNNVAVLLTLILIRYLSVINSSI